MGVCTHRTPFSVSDWSQIKLRSPWHIFFSFLTEAWRLCVSYFWDLCIISSTLLKPSEENQPQSMMLPPTCFIVGTLCLASTYILDFWPISSQHMLGRFQVFLQKFLVMPLLECYMHSSPDWYQWTMTSLSVDHGLCSKMGLQIYQPTSTFSVGRLISGTCIAGRYSMCGLTFNKSLNVSGKFWTQPHFHLQPAWKHLRPPLLLQFSVPFQCLVQLKVNLFWPLYQRKQNKKAHKS